MPRLGLGAISSGWNLFSPGEQKNIAIYIFGIVLYKFGIEAFGGAVVSLAINRYDWNSWRDDSRTVTFERVGLLTGLGHAFQCLGSILVAPLIKRWPTKNVLSVAMLVFAVFTSTLMILDAGTGGTFKPATWEEDRLNEDDFGYYGSYKTDGMIPIYCVTGFTYGMIDLIRRVIPRDIVGGDVQKLRRMDALVHVFYELAGTAAAFCTALALIPKFGNNYAFIITPICFALAALVWCFISNLSYDLDEDLKTTQSGALQSILNSAVLYFKTIYTGIRIIFTNRTYIWLIPGYAVALYAHRYIENGIAPQVARRYFGESAWSQILVGGSNFGELLGAIFIFMYNNLTSTPLPWLRIDALMMLVLWYIPYWYPQRSSVVEAWKAAATFIPISFGFAASDIALTAFIQASLASMESQCQGVSALGAVMAVLYCTYVIIYAICNPLLGKYIDGVYETSGQTTIRPALVNTIGVQFTILVVIILASTFIPRGAWSWNPKMISAEDASKDAEERDFAAEDLEILQSSREAEHTIPKGSQAQLPTARPVFVG